MTNYRKYISHMHQSYTRLDGLTNYGLSDLPHTTTVLVLTVVVQAVVSNFTAPVSHPS